MGKAKRRKSSKEKRRPVPGGNGVLSVLTGRYAFAGAFLLIAVTALLIYSNTFSVPFHFDDLPNIEENYELRDLSNFWPPSGMRYVGVLSFAVNYHFGGLEVFGYHLANLIIHIINGLLVWSLVLLTFNTPAMERGNVNPQSKYFIALTASLIFITHPVQTQAVTYIVQRFASLATLFYLLAIALYIKARLSLNARQGLSKTPSNVGQGFSLAKDQRLGRNTILLGLGSFLSAVLAMKTKEITFTLPFVILLYEFMFFEGKILSRKALLYLAPVFLTVLIIPLSMIGIDKPLGDIIGELREAAMETEAIPRGVYLLTQFSVIVTYIRLLFIPTGQNLDYDYPLSRSLFEPGVFLSFLFLLSISAFAVYLFLRSRRTGNAYGLLASFGILWFFITLSIESSIIPIKDVMFEHRLYLPSVGAMVAFGAGVFYLFEHGRVKNIQIAACILLIVTAVPLGAAAFNRNFTWKDDLTLWEDVVRKSPGNARGHNNIGKAYEEKGRIDEAIKEYKIALRLKPDFALIHNNLGIAYKEKDLLNGAIIEYKMAIGLDPDYATPHNNLGVVYADQDRKDEAIEEYKEALRLKPQYPEAHNNLGGAYIAQGRINEAIKEYQKALKLEPTEAGILNNLGLAYYGQGRLDEAIEEYKEALRLKPDFAEAHNNLGTAYRSKGLINKAIEEYKEALRLKPYSEKTHNNLGNAYAMQERINEAIKEYKEALRLKPDFAEAHNNIGNAYILQGRIDEAIEEYKEALKFKPDNKDAHFNLGLAYIDKGLKGEAIKEFMEVLRLNPRHEDARGVLQSLK